MTDATDRLILAEQAKNAMAQFLAPAFDLVAAEYLRKMDDIASEPLDDKRRAAINHLSLARRVVKEVRAQIEEIVADGAAARADTDRASKIAQMSPERRRWADMWSPT